jgi:Protein of unknown function (DUF4238)
VPRFHLRGFASEEGVLTQLDVLTGHQRAVGVNDATVRRDFYTVVLPDGSRSDAWEEALSVVEGEAAPALRRAIEMPRFRLSDEDRDRLARWIALQYLRGPDNRRQLSDIASITIRAQVGMGGIAYLRHAMTAGLGRVVPIEEAELVWRDITSARGPEITIAGDEHLEILNRSYATASAAIFSRSWARIRFERQVLAVSDAPVWPVRGEAPSFSGGLMGAPKLTVPLDRRTLLWLDLPGEAGPLEDRDRQAAAVIARANNVAAAIGAERFVYYHPEDSPIPSDVEVPRRQPLRVEVTGGPDFVNRDRPLDDVLQQISAHHDATGNSLIAGYTWPIPGYKGRDSEQGGSASADT